MKKQTEEQTEDWNKDYKEQGYQFLSRENIFENVFKLQIINLCNGDSSINYIK